MDLHLTNALQIEMVSNLAHATAGALVSGLWQGILLCATAALILKVMPRSTATLRFWVWATVFGVSVVMPFLNLPGAERVGRVGAATSHLTLDSRWSYLLAGLWLSMAIFRLVQLAVQAIGLHFLWQSARPFEARALGGLNVPLFVGTRSVELCTSDEVDRPSVIGFMFPRILIPTWLSEQLTIVELNHIVLHELEHLRRRDDWFNLIQKIGLILVPLNPALFWVDRRLCTERELACDDGVLERVKMPKAYAATLASIAERRLDLRIPGRLRALALAATGFRHRKSEFGERIEAILGHRTPLNKVLASRLAGAFVLGVVIAGAGLAHAPQLVSFDSEGFGSDLAPKIASVRSTPIAPQVIASQTTASIPVSRFQTARFHAVSYREPVKARVRRAKTLVHRVASVANVQQLSGRLTSKPRNQQFAVLTSWEDSPVSRVLVRMPDGKFFFAPYAAVPTQAGWLFVQL